MSEVLHADIFFLITGIAVIVCTALLCVVLFHGIKALQSFRRIIAKIEAGTEVIAGDLQQFRAYFSEGGFISRLIEIFTGIRRNGEPRKKSASKANKKKNDLHINDEI